MSIRRTASCCQPRVCRVVPRGARTGRGPAAGAASAEVLIGPESTPRPRPRGTPSGGTDDLLDGPGVAVGVAEEGEPAPGHVLDRGRVHAALDEVGTGPVGVVDDDLHALDRARLGGGE